METLKGNTMNCKRIEDIAKKVVVGILVLLFVFAFPVLLIGSGDTYTHALGVWLTILGVTVGTFGGIIIFTMWLAGKLSFCKE